MFNHMALDPRCGALRPGALQLGALKPDTVFTDRLQIADGLISATYDSFKIPEPCKRSSNRGNNFHRLLDALQTQRKGHE